MGNHLRPKAMDDETYKNMFFLGIVSKMDAKLNNKSCMISKDLVFAITIKYNPSF